MAVAEAGGLEQRQGAVFDDGDGRGGSSSGLAGLSPVSHCIRFACQLEVTSLGEHVKVWHNAGLVDNLLCIMFDF
jgi:hypothetical protein